ncbi:MAG: hypothetical protein IJ841_00810 [Prevotella sp.]|nr:hypothetical protein [Prevotella sp.]
MTDQEILRSRGEKYVVCFSGDCQRREHCLRWQVGSVVTGDRQVLTCVNPRIEKNADGCSMFRSDQPQRVARGMVHFYDQMSRRMEVAIKTELIGRYTRVGYYDMRKGKRPITPDVMEEIEQTCRSHGWQGDVVFDSYGDEPLW